MKGNTQHIADTGHLHTEDKPAQQHRHGTTACMHTRTRHLPCACADSESMTHPKPSLPMLHIRSCPSHACDASPSRSLSVPCPLPQPLLPYPNPHAAQLQYGMSNLPQRFSEVIYAQHLSRARADFASPAPPPFERTRRGSASVGACQRQDMMLP
jgi:hypothetical protein